jgi:hypothetical protein
MHLAFQKAIKKDLMLISAPAFFQDTKKPSLKIKIT